MLFGLVDVSQRFALDISKQKTAILEKWAKKAKYYAYGYGAVSLQCWK